MQQIREQLYSSLAEALDFKGILIDEIENIESNCGGCWFEYNNKKFYILIDELPTEEI